MASFNSTFNPTVASPLTSQKLTPLNLGGGGGWWKKGRASRNGEGRICALMGKYKGTQMREQKLTEMIEKKVMEAKQVCGEDETTDECKVAWDEVEEVSQAKAHLRQKLQLLQQDPLESFCQENPETDECRVYED